jgi:hypothetical protein
MFKEYGALWAEACAEEARRRVPSHTGRLRKSIRKKNANQKRATVVGHYSANFVDAGSKAHDIVAKKAPRLIFQERGRTIFARKVHKQRVAARPFKRAAALAAIQKNPMSDTFIQQWNKAA